MFNAKRELTRAGLLALLAVVSAGPALAADDIYAAPVATDVHSQALQWVAAAGVKDEKLREQVGKIWVLPEEDSVSARLLLAKVIATFALIDEDAKSFVGACTLLNAPLLPPAAKLLSRDGSDPFFQANLRLFYGRYLAQRQLYDEALEVFNKLDPKTVVDPATCLFYKAVCEHQLLMTKAGLVTIGKLLESTEEVPVSYTSVATLMQYELENLRAESLDEVARRMKDVHRRLGLARGGQKVQKEEDKIIATLDKIIEKLEQQQGGGGGGGNGQGKTNQPSSPANDSGIKGTTAPGHVDRKNFRKQGGWGDLPPKEEARAKNLINRNLPPHYKQAVEQYFKKIARYRTKTRSNR
jgi:hypothetical protein